VTAQHAAWFLGAFAAGVAVASVACWLARDQIRAWLPRKGAMIGPIPERYGFTAVLAFAVALIAVAVFLVH
jgi:hypothetical protein